MIENLDLTLEIRNKEVKIRCRGKFIKDNNTLYAKVNKKGQIVISKRYSNDNLLGVVINENHN